MNEKVRLNKNIMEHVDFLSRGHSNCIKINVHNTKDHEIKKALIAIDLLFEGNTIYTECEHLDLNNRSDIYVADDNKVIEIAMSETDESLEKKEIAFNTKGYKFESVRI